MARPMHVLVLCTGNSARSLLAEALLNDRSGGRIRAWSAGSKPRGEPHPLALALLAERGRATAHLRSKSWTEFAASDAPRMDVVITVCDSAAGESCPLWPGAPLKAHWGIADPAAVNGSDADCRKAFAVAYEQLAARVAALVALPFERLEPSVLTIELRRIGTLPGATSVA